PDFVSRLRGYLNVKGPNQIQDEKNNCTEKSEYVYLIRRAMLLRSLLERNAPEIIDPATKMASISTGILNAFIHVDEYLHGARSMESVITMGSLLGKNYYGPDSLPSPRLLALHVTDDFMQDILEGEQHKLPVDVLEKLAEAGYEGWREATGKNENMKYDEQTEDEKKSSREPVSRRIIALAEAGYTPQLTSDSNAKDEMLKLAEDHDLLERLMQQEHNVWLRGHLVDGWELTDIRNNQLRLHQDIRKFKELPEVQQNINKSIIQKTIEALQEAGYNLVTSER
ncbi:RyR domain-containing protein, partial [uncultured Gimesia sp.]|uniref:RyR domain-containing protein n=1 Tax=uncultured Gimesia sp. TaxID=1678688 RepID=UPI0026206EFF